MNYSHYQESIFALASSDANLAINAVAGSGKTTTAVELGRRIGVDSVTFLAFNKAIAEELQRKGLPNAATFHSAALGLLKAGSAGKFDVKPGKMHAIAKGTIIASQFDDFAPGCKQIVSLARNSCFVPDAFNFDGFLDLANEYAVDLPFDTGQAFRYTREMFRKCVEESQNGTIDFDDMLYEPWRRSIPFELAPTIIVDEAQDTNALQGALLASSSARIIIVGDPHQAIYGFRGASAGAFDALMETHDARALPLSVCYRCDDFILREARKIVPHIETAAGRAAGQVTDLPSLAQAISTGHIKDFGHEVAILCRTNAPLIRTFYSLVAKGIPARILGRAMGQQLADKLKKICGKCVVYPAAILAVVRWHAEEVTKLAQRGAPTGHIDDTRDCLLNILFRGQSALFEIADLPSLILSMFSDDPFPGQITLSTIHRAKGREWPTVIFLQPELCRPREGQPDWLAAQEQNLAYVAITRAKHHLVFAGK